jgi:GNAT superfamily N-acetyltransferase
VIKRPTGLAYLRAVTELLQRFRLAHPEAGEWEAADLQWWWRKDQHHDPGNQIFWSEGAVVFTDWGSSIGCDLLGLRTVEMLDVTRLRLQAFEAPVEMAVRDDDEDLRIAADKLGFEPTKEVAVTTYFNAHPAEPLTGLPSGFRLLSRLESQGQPHHMTGRSGPQVEERLNECSIYRKDLDLLIEGPDGQVAAYALFWPDLVTGVGLVEPVRTEEAVQGQGLASALLDEGVRRLENLGCTQIKVTYLQGNEPARRLYLGRGFQPAFSSTTFRLKH